MDKFVCSGEELGLVTHMRTVVFVKGVAAATELKSHCSSCPLYVSVMRNAPQPLLVSAPLCLSTIPSCQRSTRKVEVVVFRSFNKICWRTHEPVTVHKTWISVNRIHSNFYEVVLSQWFCFMFVKWKAPFKGFHFADVQCNLMTTMEVFFVKPPCLRCWISCIKLAVEYFEGFCTLWRVFFYRIMQDFIYGGVRTYPLLCVFPAKSGSRRAIWFETWDGTPWLWPLIQRWWFGNTDTPCDRTP